MIKVRIFGVVRLKTGVSSFEIEAKNINELMTQIPGISKQEARDLIVMVNGKNANHRCKLHDGDEVVLLSPAGGG